MKIFLIYNPILIEINRNYKIRLSFQTQKRINIGDELEMEKITLEFNNKENGIPP